MGKASSAKKIKRVQQAGVSRTPGQRRNLGYPALIVAILLAGSVLTFFAREERAVAASEAPVANRDHWHAAFGINVCGEWEPALNDDGPDTKGIHTHGDGLIHVHPFGSGASGNQARFNVYAEQVGMEIGDNEFTLPDGRTFADGDDCETEDGETKPGRVVMYIWPPQAPETMDPEVVTENFGDVRFRRDGQIFVLAFVPEDDEPSFPPSVPELEAPSDLETPPEQGSVEYTVPGGEGDAPEGETEGETGDAPAAGNDEAGG
jgi:hypothetical protein